MISRTQVVVDRNLGESQISGIASECKGQSSCKSEIREYQAVLGIIYDGSTVSRLNCHFNTRHALPLTFVRFLRPRLGRGNRAKCPRNDQEEGPIHGPGRALNLGVSLPHPQTRQGPVRIAATDASQTCPRPRSVRTHGLSLATNRRETGSFLAQSKDNQQTDAGSELIRASKRSCPTGEIAHAAFCPRSRQSSRKEANAYVLI